MSWLGSIISGAAGLLGGAFSNRKNESTANKNVDQQRKFAQKGIQWKVADAKKAGIHPLYALGANTHSFSPIAVQDSVGPAVANMGQDISRAMYATADADTRAASKVAALQVENMGLQNDLLRAQIAKLYSQVGPAHPGGVAFPVSPDSIITRDLVDVKPSEIVSARSGDPSTEAGPAGPGFKEHDLGFLGKWKLPSGAVSESLDDMELAKYALVASANIEKFGFLKNVPVNLVYQWITRPSWVDRVARKEGARTMLPFYKDGGKLFWRPVF